jgi:hypothetical protein
MLEDVAALLERARRDPETAEALSAARDNAGYPQCLCSLLLDVARDEDFRLFAAIELHRLYTAGLLPDVTLTHWVVLLDATQGRVQLQIQRIFAEFVTFCFASDQLSLALTFAENEFPLHPFACLLLLSQIARFALRFHSIDIDSLFAPLCAFLPLALDFCFANPQESAFIRASLRLAAALSRCVLPLHLDRWVSLICAFLFEKCAAQLAGVFLQQHWEKLSLTEVLSVFQAIANRLIDGSLPYKTIAPAFALCKRVCGLSSALERWRLPIKSLNFFRQWSCPTFF